MLKLFHLKSFVISTISNNHVMHAHLMIVNVHSLNLQKSIKWQYHVQTDLYETK